LAQALSICLQVAGALAAVHEGGIAHRYLKPDNIFLTQRFGQRNFVKLLNFGIVELLGSDGGSVKKTSPMTAIGVQEYMSPEQASGKIKVDARSDVYALGCILYHMVTGRLPLSGKSFDELAKKVLTRKPMPPNRRRKGLHLPTRLEDLIMDCLEKDPDKRPQTAKDVLAALQSVATSEGCELEHFVSTVPVTGLPPSRRRRRRIMVAAAMVLAALALGGISWVAISSGWFDQARQGGAAATPKPPP
jgi:serine/threonine-protein kinase